MAPNIFSNSTAAKTAPIKIDRAIACCSGRRRRVPMHTVGAACAKPAACSKKIKQNAYYHDPNADDAFL